MKTWSITCYSSTSLSVHVRLIKIKGCTALSITQPPDLAKRDCGSTEVVVAEPSLVPRSPQTALSKGDRRCWQKGIFSWPDVRSLLS